MKPKQLNKKLILNKKSIANLDSGKMREAQGGVISTPNCPMYETKNCTVTWCNPYTCIE